MPRCELSYPFAAAHDHCRVLPTDPVFKLVIKAQDLMQELCTEVDYASCESGVDLNRLNAIRIFEARIADLCRYWIHAQQIVARRLEEFRKIVGVGDGRIDPLGMLRFRQNDRHPVVNPFHEAIRIGG
jgi:hypothetical protein